MKFKLKSGKRWVKTLATLIVLVLLLVFGLKWLSKSAIAGWSPTHANWLQRKQLTVTAAETPSTETGAIRSNTGSVSVWLKTPWAGNDSVAHTIFDTDTAGTALNFNGSTDTVTVSSSLSTKSVEFWIYPSTTIQNLIDLRTAATAANDGAIKFGPATGAP